MFGAEIKINFNDFPVGQMPTNFSSALDGKGDLGDWKVISDDVPAAFSKPLMPEMTPSPSPAKRHVLAQLSRKKIDEHFPMLVYDGETFKNFKLTTQFKMISGEMEQMAGVIFRYQNASNFYVVRADAVNHNVHFYPVVNGLIGKIIGPTLDVSTNIWHTLAVQCSGDQFTFWFDGKQIMPPLHNATFSSGKIGFWTMSDAVSYFGDTTIDYTPVIPPAQALVNSIMEKYPRILGLRIYMPDEKGELQIVAAKDKSEIGKPGTDSEKNTLEKGAIFYGHGKGTVAVDMPLRDRNGDPVAAVRIELKSYRFGETQDMVLDRARIIINAMQKRVLSKEDLEQ